MNLSENFGFNNRTEKYYKKTIQQICKKNLKNEIMSKRENIASNLLQLYQYI